MLSTSHGPDSINSLLICAQAALLDGVVSNRDVINVLDVAQDLISIAANHSVSSENDAFPSIQGRLAPARTPFNNDLTLGLRIHDMRELRKLNHLELGEMIGVSSSCVEAWEDGTTVPGCNHLVPLANALNCDPLWLLTGESQIH